jgi:putative acetyltransferase
MPADEVLRSGASALSSADCTIRSVEPRDVPAIILHIRTVLREFGLEFGVGADSDDELFALPDSYSATGGAFWVVRRSSDDALLGTAGVMPVGIDACELRKMYLRPEARGSGLGGALLRLAIDHARARNARWLVLDTVDQMEQAIAFYERHGFVRDDAQMRAARCTRGYSLDLWKA